MPTDKVAHAPGQAYKWTLSYNDDERGIHTIRVLPEIRPGVQLSHAVIEYNHGLLPDDKGFAEAEAIALLATAAPALLAALKALVEAMAKDDPKVSLAVAMEFSDAKQAIAQAQQPAPAAPYRDLDRLDLERENGVEDEERERRRA